MPRAKQPRVKGPATYLEDKHDGTWAADLKGLIFCYSTAISSLGIVAFRVTEFDGSGIIVQYKSNIQ